MIRIRFPDSASERRALGYLAGHFSFKSWADGVTLVPDHALPPLAREGIPFIVDGPATYEQIDLAVRNSPTVPEQAGQTMLTVRQLFFEQMNAGYAVLRGDPQTWAEHLAERKQLDATLLDGLDPEERWSEDGRCLNPEEGKS